jgi:hypothetical protein
MQPCHPYMQGTTITASFKAVEADKDFKASGSVGVKAALKLITTIVATGDLLKAAKVVAREQVNVTGMDVDIPGMPSKPPAVPGAPDGVWVYKLRACWGVQAAGLLGCTSCGPAGVYKLRACWGVQAAGLLGCTSCRPAGGCRCCVVR